MTSRQALALARKQLETAGLRAPRDDAEALVRLASGWSRADMLAHPERRLSGSSRQRFLQLLQMRRQHYPIAYLRNHQEFFGRRFQVSPAVLIPRPETELLIDVALNRLRRLARPCTLADIGTGSGCVAVTLLCEEPQLTATATDLSAQALEIAHINASKLGCLDRLTLTQGDLLEPLGNTRFQVITSNPPYGASDDPVDLAVRRWEPRDAVFAGPGGFEIIDRLLADSQAYLEPGGCLILEIGAGQSEGLASRARRFGWQIERVHEDLAGLERCALLVPGP